MGLKVNPPPKLNRVKMMTGTYTGNGADNRNINIGIDLASKNEVLVIVKATTRTSKAVQRFEYGQGDWSNVFDAAVEIANAIQLFNATGFQVGSDPTVNFADQLYCYIVFWEEP